ncbi:hypothetical protein L9F63_025503, partial [Diploptera punctata]
VSYFLNKDLEVKQLFHMCGNLPSPFRLESKHVHLKAVHLLWFILTHAHLHYFTTRR